MAYTRLRTKKDGSQFYEIQASRKRGQSAPSMRWNVPEGWSKKSIERELVKVAAEFDRQVQAGEIVSRAERKRQESARKVAEAKILTVKKYIETVYLPYKELSCKPKTVKCYRDVTALHIIPVIGDLKINQISSAKLKILMTSVQSKGLSYRTISLVDVVLR